MNKANMFEKYITENIDAAYRFAYTYTKNKEDAEDILNESVIKALRSIHTLKDPEKIKPWFYRIISNTALTHLKKQQKIVYLSDEEMESLDVVTDDYSQLDLQSLLDVLEPKYKSILVLRFFEDMTIPEVADVLGINENTVKTRLYKALNLLKIEL